jgi:hypothetical protein
MYLSIFPMLSLALSLRKIYSVKIQVINEVRTGENIKHLRSTNVVTSGQPNLFVIEDNTDGPLVVSNYAGDQGMCRFEAIYRNDDRIYLAIGPLEGALGPEVIILPTGSDMVLSGLDEDVTVNFVDSGSYALFVASLLSYGRYMLEVCDLSPVGT